MSTTTTITTETNPARKDVPYVFQKSRTSSVKVLCSLSRLERDLLVRLEMQPLPAGVSKVAVVVYAGERDQDLVFGRGVGVGGPLGREGGAAAGLAGGSRSRVELVICQAAQRGRGLGGLAAFSAAAVAAPGHVLELGLVVGERVSHQSGGS